MDDNNELNIQAKSFKEKCANNAYYIVIFVLSLLALTFLPLLGSSVGMELNIPTTVAGWIVYVVTKLIICVLNMMIFDAFIKQAKINIKDNKNFKEANEILENNKPKGYVPRSPKVFLGHLYRRKGTKVFTSSALAVVSLGQAIFTFDFASFISYLLTIIMGCVFGFLTMKNNEVYWTSEYLDYARKVKEDLEISEKERTEQGNVPVDSDIGTDILVPIDSTRYLGNSSK